MPNIMTCQFFSFLVGEDLLEPTFVFNKPADTFTNENKQSTLTDKAVFNEDVISSGNLIFS